MSHTVADLLAAARARLDRPDPARAAALVADGAHLVDTRPGWQRVEEGAVPGARGRTVYVRNAVKGA